MKHRDIIIGILAGIASAIVLAASGRAGFASFLLFVLVPFPVYVATLGWGTRAGIIAVVISGATMAYIGSPNDAMTFTLLFSALAALVAHQVNLAQESPDRPGDLIWFPLSMVLSNFAWGMSIAVIAAGYLNGFTLERLAEIHFEAMKRVTEMNGAAQGFTESDLRASAEFYARAMPFVIPMVLMVLHMLNGSIAASVARRSNLFMRPAEPFGSSPLILPPVAVIVLVLAILALLLGSGFVQQAGAVFAGAYSFAFALSGLSALHARMRGASAGPVILFFTYFLIVVFFLPLFLFSITGISRSLRQIGNSNSGGGPPIQNDRD